MDQEEVKAVEVRKLTQLELEKVRFSQKELPKIIIGDLACFNNLQKEFLPSTIEINDCNEFPKCNEGKVKFKLEPIYPILKLPAKNLFRR